MQQDDKESTSRQLRILNFVFYSDYNCDNCKARLNKINPTKYSNFKG